MAALFDVPVPLAPISGSDKLFPVRRIFCVGRNYADHRREMEAPEDSDPIFFMKPANAALFGPRLPYPPDTNELQHEVELVVAIGKQGHIIYPENALEHVFGYACGLDMTKRDRQREAKRGGEPWERAKSFESSAPLSPIVTAASIGHPERGRIALAVNGATRQDGDLLDMIWPPRDIIARISEIWTLYPGDLIFTGTPEGVASVVFGDVIEARIEGVGGLRVEVGH